LFIITCLWTSFFACILGCGAICGAIPQNVGFSATKIRKIYEIAKKSIFALMNVYL